MKTKKLKNKNKNIYLIILILLELLFSILLLTRRNMIINEQVQYSNSYLYFESDKDIDLSKDNNIKNYNKSIKILCNNTNDTIYVTSNKPIIENNNDELLCEYNGYKISYESSNDTIVVNNKEIYELVNKDKYYYFVNLKDWLKINKTKENLTKKYNITIDEINFKDNSSNIKNKISILEIIIIVNIVLVLILILVSFNKINKEIIILSIIIPILLFLLDINMMNLINYVKENQNEQLIMTIDKNSLTNCSGHAIIENKGKLGTYQIADIYKIEKKGDNSWHTIVDRTDIPLNTQNDKINRKKLELDLKWESLDKGEYRITKYYIKNNKYYSIKAEFEINNDTTEC